MADQESCLQVSVRFRPVNKLESEQDGNKICVQTAAGRACRVNREKGPLTFAYDHVYKPGVSQRDVYEHTGKPLVAKVMAGFNTTVFAYGQTGSGKTYTMLGTANSEEHAGLVPRICQDIYAAISAEEEKGDSFEVYISMLEIYCGSVDDLFNSKLKNLKLREQKGRVYAPKATRHRVASASDVMLSIDMGNGNRAVSKTRMNDDSSRSHMVIVLDVIRSKKDGGTVLSTIKMVDLAGSEKVKKTNAAAQRLREAKKINTSLSSLGMVMEALTSGKDYVPYRSSKLALLLKDSLGGNSMTSLVCATSPCSYNMEETISTLRFAAMAKRIRTRVRIEEIKTIEEYQKSEGQLLAKLAKLQKFSKMNTVVRGAMQGFVLENHGADTIDELIKRACKQEGVVEMRLDTSGLSFEDCSGQMSMLDKQTGKQMHGEAFNAKMSLKNVPKKQVVVQEVVPSLVNSCVGGGKGVHSDVLLEMQELKDEICDLRCLLHGREAQIEDLQEQGDEAVEEAIRATNTAQKYEMEIAEARFLRQKALFLEEHVVSQLNHCIQENQMLREMLAEDHDCHSSEGDSKSPMLDTSEPGFSQKAAAQIHKLRSALRRKNRLVHKMQSLQHINEKNMMKFDKLSQDKQKVLLQKALSNASSAKIVVEKCKQRMSKAQRAIQAAKRRADSHKELQLRWKSQVREMEEAVSMSKQLVVRAQNTSEAKLGIMQTRLEAMRNFIDTLQSTSTSRPRSRPTGRPRRSQAQRQHTMELSSVPEVPEMAKDLEEHKNEEDTVTLLSATRSRAASSVSAASQAPRRAARTAPRRPVRRSRVLTLGKVNKGRAGRPNARATAKKILSPVVA